MAKDSGPQITLGDDPLIEYFDESVGEAIEHQRVDLDPDMRAYLVNVLTTFSARHALRTDDDQDLLDQPVGLQVVKALSAAPGRRFSLLRQVGDYSLYLTGFFGETVDRGMMDRGYYVEVGAGAYRRAAGALVAGGPDNPFRDLFYGLSRRFGELVGLVEEVSERCFGHDNDVLRLYDRYVATGSERLASRLTRLGVPVGLTPRAIPS